MPNRTITQTIKGDLLRLEEDIVKLSTISQTLQALNIGFMEGHTVFGIESWSFPIDITCQLIANCENLFYEIYNKVCAQN